ncbi:MFS transporter [Tundrisphaera lichenicola]|uniref:MFS transporter n=1 Tax=Tundrisphaera lichenicola TaxID=2029860 RepID=UPI003EB6A779
MSRPTGVRWRVFGLACGASFLLYLHRYTWNLVGPKVQEDFGFSNTQAGVLFSLFYYTYAAGQIPSGILIDRSGPHRFLSLIIVAWSAAIASIGQASNLAILAGLRLLFGAAQAGCYPALAQVTRTWFPAASRTGYQGWIATTSGRAGGALSPIILGSLLMGYFGLSWQTAVGLLGAIGIVYGVIFWALFRNTPSGHPGVNQAECDLISEGSATPDHSTLRAVLPAGRAWRSRSLRFFVVQQFLDAGSDVAFVSLIGTYFLQARGFDIARTGWLASLPLWGGALGGIAGGWINDRLIARTGRRRWSRSGVGFVGKVIGCVMLGLVARQETGVAAGLVLMAAKFFSDWSQPTVWGTCTDLGGRFSATVFAIINTAGTFGGVVMPVVFGLVLDACTTRTGSPNPAVATVDWGPLFLLLAAMYLGSGLCWLMIDCTRSLDADETRRIT